MTKILRALIIASIILLFASSVYAEGGRVYQIDMTISSTVYTGGASPYAGTSPFNLTYPDVTGLPTGTQEYIDLAKLKLTERVYSIQLISVEPYHDTDISGTTIAIYAKSSNDGTTWSNSAVVFSTIVSSVLSQVTTWTPESFAQFYKFEISGATIITSAAAKLACE